MSDTVSVAGIQHIVHNATHDLEKVMMGFSEYIGSLDQWSVSCYESSVGQPISVFISFLRGGGFC